MPKQLPVLRCQSDNHGSDALECLRFDRIQCIYRSRIELESDCPSGSVISNAVQMVMTIVYLRPLEVE